MIYELDVVQSDSERIGDPVALPLTDIINNGGSTNRLGKISWNLLSNILIEDVVEATNDKQASATTTAAGMNEF